MRLTRLVLAVSFGALAACGGSKKPATMPADTMTAPAPAGGDAAEGAVPVETTNAEPAMAPGAPAPAPASAPPPAEAPKGTTRGAVKKPASGDPDAGGE
ncbi:MAG: hypothetical protein JNL83_34235 [Myxococcales bacterium]|nr:hypothetical protein [Myxococcales bacterium]